MKMFAASKDFQRGVASFEPGKGSDCLVCPHLTQADLVFDYALWIYHALSIFHAGVFYISFAAQQPFAPICSLFWISRLLYLSSTLLIVAMASRLSVIEQHVLASDACLKPANQLFRDGASVKKYVSLGQLHYRRFLYILSIFPSLLGEVSSFSVLRWTSLLRDSRHDMCYAVRMFRLCNKMGLASQRFHEKHDTERRLTWTL